MIMIQKLALWMARAFYFAREALCRKKKIVKKSSNRHIGCLEFGKFRCIMKMKKRKTAERTPEGGCFEE